MNPTSTQKRDALYRQLPRIVRKRDGELGGPLQSLLHVIGEQAGHVEQSIDQLYNDLFVETSQAWTVPYIGQLMDVAPSVSHPADGEPETRVAARHAIVAPRRQVADAARHYRRKGSLSVLEDLAASTAGWPARAVEFQNLVLATMKPGDESAPPPTTLDLRKKEQVDYLDTPFDQAGHTIDLRDFDAGRRAGRMHHRNVGLFVWLIPSRSMTGVAATCHGTWPWTVTDDQGNQKQDSFTIYSFDPTGAASQLFVSPVPERVETDIASPGHVPTPLTISMLTDPGNPDCASCEYYGIDRSLEIWEYKNEKDPDKQAKLDSYSFIERKRVRPYDLSAFRCFPCKDIQEGGSGEH